MKNKLLVLLLCLVMAVGILPTTAMAGEDSRNPVVQFTIVKKVEMAENAATPPAEVFAFVLEDTANEKKSVGAYGITLLDDLQIETNGANAYEKTIKAKIDMAKVNPNGGWEAIIPIGSQTPSSYYKTFHLAEVNDGKDGWSYSTAKYAVTFKYDCDAQNMTCGVYEIGNDVSFRTADFTNTYTKQDLVPQTVELPFTVTVKQGGNVAPGKQAFELELFDYNGEPYDGLSVSASVETNGVKDYDGQLVISGTADQMGALYDGRFFVREKNTKAANWTYSDAVWYVDMSGERATFYPAELQVTDNGNYYVHDEEKAAEKMTFVNTYTENKTVAPTNPEKPTNPEQPTNPAAAAKKESAKSPQTGDNSVMGLWIALLFVSGGALAGTTLYSRKRKSVK